MSNIEVTVTAGYRCVFTTEQWRKFCQQLQDEVNSEFGSDDGSGSESGSDDGSGSDNGSDNGSHCSGCSDDDVSDNGAEMNVQTNLDKFICFLDIDDLSFRIPCCIHKGMDYMVDIGFVVTTTSVLGDHEGSHSSFEQAMNSMKNAQKSKFTKKMQDMFFWNRCTNKRGPEILGQANDCAYCTLCQ